MISSRSFPRSSFGLTAGALDELHRDGYEGSPTVVGQLNMRYHGQNFGELITVQAGELDVPAFEAAIQSFHQKHEDMYGYALPDTVVEVTEVRALAIGTREPPPGAHHRVGHARRSTDAAGRLVSRSRLAGQRHLPARRPFCRRSHRGACRDRGHRLNDGFCRLRPSFWWPLTGA